MKELKLDLKPLLKKANIATMKNMRGKGMLTTGSGEGQAGSRRAVFGAKGMEFEKFREFSPGDDADRIDWVASLRAQKPLVRVYSEEENKNIMFLLDVSSSMSYASHEKLKNEYAAELIATLTYALSNSGDAVGLVMFTDRLTTIVPANVGKPQFLRVLREVSNPANYEGKYDLGKALTNFVSYKKRPCVTILISDFIGLKPGWEEMLKRMSAMRYEIYGICIRDPLDDKFPEEHFIGQVVINDPYSTEQLLMDPNRLAKKYESHNIREMAKIREAFKKSNSKFIVLHTNEPFLDKIRRFFSGGL